MPCEGVARPPIALTIVAVPLSPPGIIAPVPPMHIRGLTVIARTTAERPRIIVTSVARSDVGLPPVVIAIAVVGGTTAPAIWGVSVPLAVARIVVARIKIEHAALR